jgi:hypothetical protein
MGQGAFMTVENKSKTPIMLFVNGVSCMYDNGEQGSNLQTFNSVEVDPGQQVPSSGKQYIEDKDSGTCAFDTATFTLAVTDSKRNSIGTVAFSESSSSYSAVSSNTDLIQVLCSNDTGDQSIIVVTVL